MNSRNKKILEFNKRLIEFFGIPKRAEVLPKPIDMLIATILSQNTNDKNSIKAYKNLKEHFNSWEQVLEVDLSNLAEIIKSAGMKNQKAKAIKNLIKNIWEQNGNFELEDLSKYAPDEAIEFLTKFNGVGVKTASCVLLFSLDKNVCPVDTHLFRILNRLGITNEKTRDATYFSLNKDFPKGIAHQFHTNLIRLGREICLPKEPICGACVIKEDCNYPEKNLSNNSKRKTNDFFLLDSV